MNRSARQGGSRLVVGIVGGGQLALMMFEASLRLDIDVRVLAASDSDSVVGAVPDVVVGDPNHPGVLAAFAAGCDALTFDHEQVDPTLVEQVSTSARRVHPSAGTLAVSVDKWRQSELFERLGIPAPESVRTAGPGQLHDAVNTFGGRAVAKNAGGGYDGRGVHVIDEGSALPACGDEERFVVQELVDITSEHAVVLVRAADGETRLYPPLRTVQVEGICHRVEMPSGLDASIEQESVRFARLIAEELGVVGVMAVEFLLAGSRLMVNEIATRPHNSGHLTIESTRTSQFENHLRAVVGLPLGETDPVVEAGVMVNLLSPAADPVDVDEFVARGGAVHLYRKQSRPGRKVGHVTFVADSLEVARSRAGVPIDGVPIEGTPIDGSGSVRNEEAGRR